MADIHYSNCFMHKFNGSAWQHEHIPAVDMQVYNVL